MNLYTHLIKWVFYSSNNEFNKIHFISFIKLHLIKWLILKNESLHILAKHSAQCPEHCKGWVITSYHEDILESDRTILGGTADSWLQDPHPGPPHLPSNRFPTGSTVALGHCGNSKVLQILLQIPQHWVQGGLGILLIRWVLLAGICFHCNLAPGKEPWRTISLMNICPHWHLLHDPLSSPLQTNVFFCTQPPSKALEESNIVTPIKMLLSPFYPEFLRPGETPVIFLHL